ncbi:MAG: alkanesulfonate monooxygenase SsuD [Gammaproteobacteria bacterium]|jgi:alkanesulfonate monooxygenase SsuD/methylene tetrahydromethanopterin reductase-like flavin-dependent oxidoreductase (luciferase family)
MRFGLFGGPVRRDAMTSDAQSYAAYIESVLEAERLGYYGAYLVEHHFTGRGQVSASLNLLAHLAGLTSKIRLGTAVVVVPWHNPALLAEQAATVDLLSGGRLDLGLGRGYRDNEFAGFGVDRAQATARFDDTLAFLTKAWTTTERFSFKGEHWTLTDVVIEPKPIQQPHPPLWVGAASDASISAAAQQGLCLFLDQVATVEEVAQRVSVYREAQHQAGRTSHPNDIALTRPLLLSRDENERATLLESHLGTLEQLASSAADNNHNPFYSVPEERRSRAENGAILGPPSECIKRLERLRDIGIHQVLFTRTSPDALGRFAAQVMPHLIR